MVFVDVYLKLLFLIFVCVAAYTDWRERVIPNEVNLILFATGIMHGVLTHRLLDSILGILMGITICVLPAVIMRVPLLQGIGGGDVKMIVALGAWYGYHGLLWVVVAGGILAVVTGVYQLARSGKLRLWLSLLPVRGKLYGEEYGAEVTLPFGTHLAVGVFLVEITKLLL